MLNIPIDGGCSVAPWPVSSSEWPGSHVLPSAGLAVSESCSNCNRFRLLYVTTSNTIPQSWRISHSEEAWE